MPVAEVVIIIRFSEVCASALKVIYHEWSEE